jgi:hypothetical protein
MGKGRMDRQIEASKRVELALGGIGNHDAYLLSELIFPKSPTSLSSTTWRGVVAYVTGEENPHAQSAVVRMACTNLAKAYDKMLRAA